MDDSIVAARITSRALADPYRKSRLKMGTRVTLREADRVSEDWMVEGSEFELPVPVSKLSDDNIMLEFATARRIALIARRPQCRAWRARRKASVTGSGSRRRRPDLARASYCRALFEVMSTTAFASRGSYLGIRAAHKVRVHARFAKLPQELALLAWLAIPIVPCQQVPPRGLSPSHAHDTAEQQTTHQCCRLPLLSSFDQNEISRA